MKHKQLHKHAPTHHQKQYQAKRIQRLELVIGMAAGVGVLFFVGLVLVLGIRSNASLFQKHPQPVEPSAGVTASSPIKAPLLTTTVTNSRVSMGEHLKPNTGYQFVLLHAVIKHQADHPIWLAPALQSYVKDDHDQRYSLTFTEVSDPFQAGEYPPNHAVAGDLGYEVPLSAKGLQWCYQLEIDPNNPVCTSLTL